MRKGCLVFIKALYGEKNDIEVVDEFTDEMLIEMIKEHLTDEEFKIIDAHFGLTGDKDDSKYDDIALIMRKLKNPTYRLGKTTKNYIKK